MARKYGRTFKIKSFKDFQLEIGVINRDYPKSIYFDIKCYLTSIDTNYRQNMRKFVKSIENTLEVNLDKVLFKDKYIFVIDSPHTFKDTGTGFVSISVSLFLKYPEDFSEKHYVSKITTLVEIINNNLFQESELFEVKKSNKNLKKKLMDL
jgi:hypothetical protein